MSQDRPTDFSSTPSNSGVGQAGGSPNPLADRSTTGAATAPGLVQTAQQYGEKISEAAGQAKEFVTDKMGVVGDKFKEIQNADYAEIAENAKDYARKNPGQAILISAAAGLLLGLVLRGRKS